MALFKKSPEDHYKKALDYINKKDYEKAEEFFLKAAESNHINSLNMLAQLYYISDILGGCDIKKSKAMLERMAKAGHSETRVPWYPVSEGQEKPTVNELILDFEKRIQKANTPKPALKKTADDYFEEGKKYIGTKEYDKAKALLLKGVDADHINSIYALSQIYIIVEKDFKRGADMLQKMHDLGCGDTVVGWLKSENSPDRTVDELLEYLKDRIARESAPKKSADDYYNEASKYVKAGEYEKAEAVLLKAVDMGHVNSMYVLIQLYYRPDVLGGCDLDKTIEMLEKMSSLGHGGVVLPWFEKGRTVDELIRDFMTQKTMERAKAKEKLREDEFDAYDRMSPEELFKEANKYDGFSGLGPAKGVDAYKFKGDPDRAVYLYKLASDKGHAEAKHVLGIAFYYGIGPCKQDYDTAFILFVQSLAMGYEPAFETVMVNLSMTLDYKRMVRVAIDDKAAQDKMIARIEKESKTAEHMIRMAKHARMSGHRY